MLRIRVDHELNKIDALTDQTEKERKSVCV